jgi:hypothetical protein
MIQSGSRRIRKLPVPNAAVFHEASLSRHNRKCRNRQAIAHHKSRKFDGLRQVAWTQRPDSTLSRQPVPYDFLGTIGAEPSENDDLKIEFEPPASPRLLKPANELQQELPDGPVN